VGEAVEVMAGVATAATRDEQLESAIVAGSAADTAVVHCSLTVSHSKGVIGSKACTI